MRKRIKAFQRSFTGWDNTPLFNFITVKAQKKTADPDAINHIHGMWKFLLRLYLQ